MEVFEITGFRTGVSKEGVNYLQPSDSFQNINNGFIHREVLQSRKGFKQFSSGRLGDGDGEITDGSRVMGIFQHVKLDNSHETLVVTKNYLYKYNESTNAFDQIVNDIKGSADAFGITASAAYVSGTSYPSGAGKDRFVFCSVGLNDILFYENDEGVDTVKSFTDGGEGGDNPDFEQFAGGDLTSAWFVNRFNGRINFYNPLIAGLPNPQGVLYSAINDSSGNGDKFNTVGAGLLAADTQGFLNGVVILGNSVVLSFSESVWTLEKTTDVYNPYFIKRLSGSVGTSAPFSTVTWGNEARSLGRNGIVTTDLRTSWRADNKIPDFTRDEMDSKDFSLSYGGFSKQNTQFLWAYKSAIDGDEIQDKVLVNGYREDTWSTYDMRMSVIGFSDNGQSLAWDDIFEDNNPSWVTWDTTEEIWNDIGQTQTVDKTLAGDDNGYIYVLDTDYDDYTSAITGITQASPAVLSCETSGFAVGDEVFIEGVAGMIEINNFDAEDPTADVQPYVIEGIGSGEISLNVDSRLFTEYTSGGLISKPIDFSAELIPFNPYRDNGRKCYVSYIDFLVETNNGFLTVDIFADEESTPFKSGILAKTTSLQKRRQWVSIVVNNESEFMTLKFTQKNPALQLKVTSIRIHASPGGMTGD